MKIALIKEGKTPADKRVAFTPEQVLEIHRMYKDTEIFVESSDVRCYDDEEYAALGIQVVKDVSACDVFFGIKEVPIQQLIPNKNYFFFSHTIKKQAYNRALLQSVLEKNIKLIDYEVLKNDTGERVAAFGRWAGIVGAYNAFWTYGKKTDLYHIKRAFDCFDRQELKVELKKVQLPPIKIVVTGTGRVGKGTLEVLSTLGIREIEPHDFLFNYYEEPVFTLLSSSHYNRRRTDGGFDKNEFYSYPEKYESHFLKYAEVSDILISGAYWDNRAPRLFREADIKSEDFSISVIADITCDIRGSLPTTIRASKVHAPVYDIDRDTFEELPAFGKQFSISVMAIDNLPTELPRDASKDFGEQLIKYVVPELHKSQSTILEKATIAQEGDLTFDFLYLRDYLNNTNSEKE
ncbi:alanine dehydrogenase [Belliella baltica DSM 15883]|uniref:Saccharopine dehydrogenase [NAD(+), L-lysine-forming] n=1 Tax=Belliella baltica (strain DSM 15883 / CIP 108006 / LMG 21964 / BA134) TaxID=866536 RepID=I3Z4D7_BELBD|nr:NAD(P)-dependent oxidoreductase [Belliella baltica]AFL84105.1 alanine dehydrogenase [Belliella baltica DSM 15883]